MKGIGAENRIETVTSRPGFENAGLGVGFVKCPMTRRLSTPTVETSDPKGPVVQFVDSPGGSPFKVCIKEERTLVAKL